MKLIVLVGIPGAGKSSFAAKYKNYVTINQDTLGDRYTCLELFRKSLSEKKNIIIDRCNINRMQRSLWTSIAKEHNYEVSCINFVISKDMALTRILNRKDHPTIKETMTLGKVKSIINNFEKSYEPPTLEEGFSKILFIKVK